MMVAQRDVKDGLDAAQFKAQLVTSGVLNPEASESSVPYSVLLLGTRTCCDSQLLDNFQLAAALPILSLGTRFFPPPALSQVR